MFIPMVIFAPWVPTSKKDVKRIWDLIKIWDKDVLYDLWSWDGKVLFEISKKYNCKLIWVESFLPLYIFSLIKKYIYFKEKNITFKLWNFFSYNLKDASIIYVFWLEWKMWTLEKKLKNECIKWTKVISYIIPFPTLRLIKKDKPKNADMTIYIYKI